MIGTTTLVIREILHRWKTSLLFTAVVMVIIAAVTFYSVTRDGFEKEITRNVRDIGSNVVILPAEVDQLSYYRSGGFASETMSEAVMDQLIEYRASLNHLIPMLEVQTRVRYAEKTVPVRLVGISASVPMPGRPKSPMQRSIPQGQVQLGSELAATLGIQRDDKAEVVVQNQSLRVARVNRSNGTWQDGAVLLDLSLAQTLFNKINQLSRIEAIECTQEECERTGLKSETVLSNELARITDQAVLLRREQMANARASIRSINHSNSVVIQNMLWTMLVLTILAMTFWNTLQRRNEMGVFQAIGYGSTQLLTLLVGRSVLLTLLGGLLGGAIGSWLAHSYCLNSFEATGKRFTIDWSQPWIILLVSIVLAGLAACLPALIAATRLPADSIGKES